MTDLKPDYLKQQLETMAPHRALLRSVECKFMADVPLISPSLDIGCGEGHFASIAYDRPIDVGIDPLAKDLEEARTKVPVVYRHLLLGSATALPFPDCSFQTVVSNSVIEHIEDIDSVVHEIARVLKPGGVFAATYPSEYYPEYLLGTTLANKVRAKRVASAYGNFFNRISYHHHIDSPNIWAKRYDDAGLSVETHTYYFSPEAHQAFDIAHYLGMPNLLSTRVLGRWVTHPLQT